ncbi:MAG: hypothetical protein CMO81_00920 [Waddliaceae bacterium]|nr:hypothetical protein [Waddliaceae bacterium]
MFRKFLSCLLIPSIIACSFLSADSFRDREEEDNPFGRHFFWDNEFYYYQDADFTDIADSIRYYEGRSELRYQFGIDPEHAIYIGGGYELIGLKWLANPHFSDDRFERFIATVGLVSVCFTDWVWKSRISLYSDLDEAFRHRYNLYEGMAWGTYDWNHRTNVHIGLLARIGMHQEDIYPILGFDYRPTQCWEFSVIFPMDTSIMYHPNEDWSMGVAIRYAKTRARVGALETVPNAIFEYMNYGGELRLNFHPHPAFKLSLVGGSTISGEIEVFDATGNTIDKQDIDPSIYFGGSLDLIY